MSGLIKRRPHASTLVVICLMGAGAYWVSTSNDNMVVVTKEDSPWIAQLLQKQADSGRSLGKTEQGKAFTVENMGALDDESIWLLNKDAETQKVTPKTQVKLILLGYKRGGTTFTSALLYGHPDVFFVYEPLWYFLDPDFTGVGITDQTLPISEHIKSQWKANPFIPEPLSYIRAMLSCQITNATMNFVKYPAGSRDVRALRACLKTKTIKDKNWCFRNTTRHCLTRTVTSLKTVRLSVAESGRIMEADPLVKVIFIARDPRGNSNSYEQTLKARNRSVDEPMAYQPTWFYGDALMKEKCRIMNADATALIDLSKKYKDRILTVRYEDVADDPVGMTTKLLKFVNLEMRPEVMNSIADMTHSLNVTKIFFTVTRNNSSSTASKWREQLSYKKARDIEQECEPFFHLLKYHIFKNEEDMRNTNLPYRDNTFGENEGLSTLTL